MSRSERPAPRRRISDWLYQQLLRAYPPYFRESFGSEMSETFRELRYQTRERGGIRSRLGLWLRVSWDVIRTGLAERRRNRSPLAFSNPLPLVWSDLRFGLRTLRRNPTYATGVVITLALGIGAVATVFSQVNGLLLRPLPYSDPERLVQLSETAPGISSMDLSFPDFSYWQQNTEIFESMTAFDDATFALAQDGAAERVEGAVVSPSMFLTLGIQPIVGRAFRPEEGEPGAEPVVIISHGFWVERLGSDPGAVGKSLVLNGRSRTIIGVAPSNFMFPERAELWVPITLDPLTADPNDYDWDAVARIRAGLSLDQALAEAGDIARELAAANPDTKASIGAIAYPLRDANVNDDVRLAYAVLLASVTFVLLIACVNVSNLVVTRGASRRQELAVRRAMGASRARIASQHLVENGLLAFVGGGLGVLLSVWVNSAIWVALPVEVPFWVDIGLDGAVLAFVFLISTATTLVLGLVPAVDFSLWDQAITLRSVTHGKSSSVRGRGTFNLLLVIEIALSFVLLVASTMTMRGFLNLRATSPGFSSDGILAVGVYAPTWTYSSEERLALYQRLVGEVSEIPGVTDVSLVSELPIGGGENEIVFAVEGRETDPAALPVANGNVVTPAYFTTMRIPLIRGREFGRGDALGSPPVAIVSQSLAERYWPGEDPVGRRIRVGILGNRTPTLPGKVQWHTVVGVVSDVRHEDLATQGRMGIYLPFAQVNAAAMTLVVRTDAEPLTLAEVVRSRIWQVGSGIVIFGLTTMDQVLNQAMWSARIIAELLGGFAIVALTLAAVGVYGVVAFTVARRTSEIGIRVAMGARHFDVVRLVLSQTALTLVVGLALGLGGALVIARVLSSIVYEVSAHDPAVFAGMAAVLLSCGLFASYLPTRRAMRLDPADTLRRE